MHHITCYEFCRQLDLLESGFHHLLLKHVDMHGSMAETELYQVQLTGQFRYGIGRDVRGLDGESLVLSVDEEKLFAEDRLLQTTFVHQHYVSRDNVLCYVESIQ